MDRIIDVKVNGYYLTKNNLCAGVQHEANSNRLRITFDDGWDGYAKTVTFWDARGENPVKRTLTTDLLENAAESTRIYLVDIPGEPMEYAGMMQFVIDGYVDGKRMRSIGDRLRVKEAPWEPDAAEPMDPTPSQAEQLQAEIDRIQSTIQQAAQSALAAALSESHAADHAQRSNEALLGAQAAQGAAESAQAAAEDAQGAAEAARAAAEAAQAAAEQDRIDVQSAQVEAANSARQAASSETNARASEASAAASASDAAASENAAAGSEANARASETSAAASAASAAASKNAAAESETNAANSAAAAAKSAADASAAAGGDFATREEAKGYADTAEENANAYTDRQIAYIPTPDVSGQIEDHNTDTHAHADIREALVGKETAGAAEQVQSKLDTHASDTAIHVTAAEKAAWNDSDVFIAEYGVTKNSEIEAAFQAGKAVFVFDGCYFAPLSDWEGDAEHIFSNSYTRMQCVNDVWSYGEDSFEPAKHAGTHKSNGSDPITPASIGAAAASHTHTGYAPAYTYGTSDLTAGTSELATGKLYFVYE